MSKHKKGYEGRNLPPGIYDRKVNVMEAFLDGAKGQALFRELFSHGGVAACNMDKDKLFVLLTEALAVHDVLQDNELYAKGDLAIDSGTPLIGKVNMFTAAYKIWKILRKAAAPQAYRSKMPVYWQKMWQGFANVYDTWEGMSTVDLSTESARAMFQVGAFLFFSKSFSLEEAAVIPNAISYLHVLQGKIPMRKMLGPIFGPIMYYAYFRGDAYQSDVAVANKNKFVDALIAERKVAVEDGQEFTDVLQIILDSMDNDELRAEVLKGVIPPTFERDQVSTFSVGFGETTATTLAHMITGVLTHPTGQKVVQEITNVIGTGVPTYEQLSKLVYSKRFIKEVWRTGPPSFWFARTNEGQWAKIRGYDIPPNSTIIINVFGIHHRGDYYPHPNEFEPDRYDPTHAWYREVEGTADVTFGDGPRICWGVEHAMMLALASLIQFVQRYLMDNSSCSVSFVNPPLLDEYQVPIPVFKLTLRPQPGLLLAFNKS
jgi:cytochrome P450